MVSGNDAAIALSEAISGTVDNFVDLMNKKAIALGLNSTHFVTPHGLDQDEHYTTAFELAKMADYALQNEKFSKIVKTSTYTVSINGSPKNLHNTNELLGYMDGVYGVKTGFTNGANRCLVTSCKRGSLDIICVVLGCDTKKDRTIDSINLINYIFNNFSVVNVKDIIEKNFDEWSLDSSNYFDINKSISNNLDLYFDKNQILFENIAVENNLINNVNTTIYLPKNFEAPIFENSVIGKMDVVINNVNYFSVDILNRNAIKRKNILDYWKIFFMQFPSYFRLLNSSKYYKRLV